jgi:hypothetical protein
MSNQEEKLLSSEQVYAGKFLNLNVDTVLLPNGRTTKLEIFRHIWTPPCLQAGFLSDERRVCGHISGFMMELVSFRALMVVARQLLSILTA